MTSITITTKYGSSTITSNKDDMSFMEFIEEVLEPALLTVYGAGTVGDWMRGADELG